MKKYIKFLICLLAVSLITFQACKKDNELTNPKSPTGDKLTENTSFNSKEIENMDEYLMNFMKEIKTQTRNAETMSVEDAQWHISACLNFMYCNANVDRTVVTYDTVYTSIMANDGCVSMNDINNSLQAISEKVSEVYNYSMLENKNILFIQPVILDEATRSGATVRTVVAMSNNWDYYYFDEADRPMLDSIFPEGSSYLWRTEAIDTLEYYINVFKPTKIDVPGRVYYTITTTLSPRYFQNYFIQSDYINNRLFYTFGSYHTEIPGEHMRYYLDSYLGLIEEARNEASHGGPTDLVYISSDIVPCNGFYSEERSGNEITLPQPYHHLLYVYYGIASHTNNPVIPPIN